MAPPAWGTAWAGSGWPLKGQCWGKDKRWRPRGDGWVPAWPVLGVRRIQAGKAVISVYRCRCGGVQLGVGGLLAQSADWELEGQDSHQGLGSGFCNSSSVRWASKDAVLTWRVGPGLNTWGILGLSVTTVVTAVGMGGESGLVPVRCLGSVLGRCALCK